MIPMFSFVVKKELLLGTGLYVGSGTVPPLFELAIIAGNQSMQVYVQNFTTLAAAKAAAVALLAEGTVITWTDNSDGTFSYSNLIAQPASV